MLSMYPSGIPSEDLLNGLNIPYHWHIMQLPTLTQCSLRSLRPPPLPTLSLSVCVVHLKCFICILMRMRRKVLRATARRPQLHFCTRSLFVAPAKSCPAAAHGLALVLTDVTWQQTIYAPRTQGPPPTVSRQYRLLRLSRLLSIR